MNFGFIGAGKVGFSLGKYLSENGISISGYYSKNLHSANEAGKFTNSKSYENLEDLVNSSDIIFITTGDRDIEVIWNEIKKLPINKKLVCHCSGSISSEVFSNIESLGAYGYSIHPIFPIRDKYNSYKDLKKAFITIEGHEKYKEYFSDLFRSFGNNIAIISSENKSLYHASAVMVSNLVLGLINSGASYLEQCGFSKEQSLEALFPLIEGNINNIKNNGIKESLTGPIERGDLLTIKKHVNSMDKSNQELYRVLSRNIVPIAKEKNKSRDYSEIEEYLGGFYEEYSSNF